MGDTTHGHNRLAPEEVELLREESRQAEERLAILAARSPAVHHLKVGLKAEPDEPEAEGQACSSRDSAGQPSRKKLGLEEGQKRPERGIYGGTFEILTQHFF